MAGTQGMLVPGSTVAGYVIEEQVGAGGMAVVYRARDEVLGRLVAVKVLSPALAADVEFRTRFLRESRAVAAVDEPHIVPVYGAGEAGGLLYIATRFVAGGDLTRLQRAAGGRLWPARAADLISQVAGALDAAHAIGLVHRDVKPGNILVESLPGRPEHAYLSDFGLSKSTTPGATGLTAAGRFMGTPDYCAPEQVTGAAVDGRTDQYSLACVAFALLAGVVPFSNGDSMARLFSHVHAPVPAVTTIRPELPAAVDGVLARAMAKNPAERYESCAAFARALHGALGIPPAAGVGYQQTITAAAWQHPSLPPGPVGWQQPGTPSGPAGGWQPGPPAGGWQPGPAPGPWQPQPPGPGRVQRPPRKNTGLIVGGSIAAAVVLVVGVIVGVTLTSQHGTTGGSSGSTSAAGGTTSSAAGGTTSSAAGGATSSAAGADQSGTATLVGTLSVPGGNLKNGAFLSADGDYVAASGKAGIYVFSTETVKLVSTLSVAAGDEVDPVGFSPDDKTLYAVDLTAGKVYDLDIATGKQLNVYSMPAGSGLTFSYGASVINAINSSGTDVEYSMATGRVVATVPNPGSAPVVGVGTDRTGQHMLISDKNGVAYLVDAPSAKVIAKFSYPYAGTGPVYPVISPDGNTVDIIGGPPGDATAPAKLWDTATGSYITPTDTRWPALDNGVTFSTDSRFALTSPTAVSDVVDVWDIATRAHVITVTVPGGANENIVGVGPSASELLSTGSLNVSSDTYSKLYIWAVPG